ncbi:MAG: PorV/PorQ family protein [Ignavibacteriales bacterium]|nr:PorV/PorQ family protein [Ignavibacteriales bacterium]
MKNKLYITIVLIFFTTSAAFAQLFVTDVSKKGTTAAPFLSIAQGARATAMGGAFVSVSDDQSAIYWNPAGLAKTSGIGVIFDHTSWLADVSYNFLAASYNLGDMGVLGFSFTTSDYGDMKVTTIEEPNGTGESFTARDAAFSLAYALNLTDNFAIGFNPKFVYQSLWKMSAMAVALDVGVQYRTPFAGIILAAAVSNFGTKMKLTGESNLILVDLDTRNGGNNDKIPAYLQTNEWALPLNFRVGLGYTAEFNDQNKLTLAIDAMHPSDNYESINVGAEYWFMNLIALRGGYNSMFLKNSEATFAVGLGIKQQLLGNFGIRFDYAYQDFGRLKNIQKFTLGLNF